MLVQIRREVAAGDTIVFLGDYIDRGPDSKGCVDAILGFQREVEAEVVCLLGNHEDWFLRTLRDHRCHSWLLGMEAFDTIRDRLMACGATDGFVTDFGQVLSVFFTDPDGLEGEVCVTNPDAQPGAFNPPGTPAARYHGDG